MESCHCFSPVATSAASRHLALQILVLHLTSFNYANFEVPDFDASGDAGVVGQKYCFHFFGTHDLPILWDSFKIWRWSLHPLLQGAGGTRPIWQTIPWEKRFLFKPFGWPDPDTVPSLASFLDCSVVASWISWSEKRYTTTTFKIAGVIWLMVSTSPWSTKIILCHHSICTNETSRTSNVSKLWWLN